MSPGTPSSLITPKTQCLSIKLPSCPGDQLLAMWASLKVTQYWKYCEVFDKPSPCLPGFHAARERPLEWDASPAAGSDGRQYGRPSSRGAHLRRRLHNHRLGTDRCAVSTVLLHTPHEVVTTISNCDDAFLCISGASSDFDGATKIAKMMVTRFGMSDKVKNSYLCSRLWQKSLFNSYFLLLCNTFFYLFSHHMW